LWREYKAKAIAADSTVGRLTLAIAEAAREVLIASRVRGTDAPELRAYDEAVATAKLTSLDDADRPDLDIALALALAGHPDRARALLAKFQTTVRDTAVIREMQP